MPYQNGSSDATITDRGNDWEENLTLVWTDAIPSTVKNKLVKKMLIHASRRIIINTDGEEETGKPWMGRGHWVINICYGCNNLWLNFEQVLLLCSAQFWAFDIMPFASWVKQGFFSNLKISNQQLFLRLCGRRVGLKHFSKSGLRTIHL